MKQVLGHKHAWEQYSEPFFNKEKGYYIADASESTIIIEDWALYHKFTGRIHRPDSNYFQATGVNMWFKDGVHHREDGPAWIYGLNEAWFWEGQEGLEHFPDWALAKLGDKVI